MPHPKRLAVGVHLGSFISPAKDAIREGPEAVVITSPYMTSSAAEEVIQQADSKTTVILTTFEAETFASGGSSLATLRALVSRGYQLRSLEGLHAKIILTADWCFVGSQNLTAAGTRNREATSITNDPTIVSSVAASLRHWRDLSAPITLEMIDEMDRLIEPLLPQFEELKKAAATIDAEVRAREVEREARRRQIEAEQAELERRRANEELVRHLQNAHTTLQSAVRASEAVQSVPLRLQRVAGTYSWRRHYSLLAPLGEDLTALSYGNDIEVGSLTKRQRYLLIVPEIGRLGWPALNKTRLTRFGAGLEPSGYYVNVNRRQWQVTNIDLNQDLKSLDRWNVRFTLQVDIAPATVELLMKFTLSELELIEAKGDENWIYVGELFSALSSKSSRVWRDLRRALLRPFKYSSNSLGIGADRFCDGLMYDFLLTLRSYGGQAFFTLEST